MGTAFDRARFKGAKLSATKDVQKEAQANNKSFGGGTNRVGFLTIDEGRNVFRILPPHPDDTVGAAYLPKRVAQLECEVPVYKDGEDTGKTEIKNKNIFIATQHGGLPKDPIELYIDYVRKRAADEFQDKDDRQKFLQPITGWRDKKGTWNWGISPKTSFVTYAIKNNEMGRLELYDSMIKDMDKLAVAEDAEDVMEVDPFSDPSEGSELIITKEKQKDKQGKETNKWDYIISMGSPSKNKREDWPAYYERVQVTDAQLTELLEQEPLSKIMGNRVYTSRDWDYALDGLKRLDDKYKFEIFENDEFLDELKELAELVVEFKRDDKDVDAMFEKKDQQKEVVEQKKVEKKPETVVEKGEEVDDDSLSILDMKMALKSAVKRRFGAQYLDQVPTKDQEIQKWYQLLDEGEDLPIVLEEADVVEEIPTIKAEKVTVSEEGSVADAELSEKIKNLRSRGHRS